MAFRWPQHNLSLPTPLDYSIDWRRWLNGRTIVDVAWTIENAGEIVSFDPVSVVNDLTALATTNTTTVATLYLQGGRNNIDYRIFCTITPSDGPDETREIRIRTKVS